MKYGYLVVEGPHDVEFIARVLKPHGLRRIRLQSDLDPFWESLVPEVFPIDDDLLKRVPVPTFFTNATHSVAIDGAMGDTLIVETVQESLAYIEADQLVGVGLMLDADTRVTPSRRFLSIKNKLASLGVTLNLPDNPGQVSPGHPKAGVFILPDNQSQATLENILIWCAKTNYRPLLKDALAFVRQVNTTPLNRDDLRELGKPAGRKKAVVSSISSILKPGKAIQVSIQDNHWLIGDALDLPKVKAVQTFLAELLELP